MSLTHLALPINHMFLLQAVAATAVLTASAVRKKVYENRHHRSFRFCWKSLNKILNAKRASSGALDSIPTADRGL